MEMPINIIVILFIAIVVGGAVLYFTNNTLLKSSDELDRLREDPASKDMVVELASVDQSTIMSLANECVRRGQRDGGLQKSLCFAVFSGSFSGVPAIDGAVLDQGFRLNTSQVPATGVAALRIQYDPAARQVIVAP